MSSWQGSETVRTLQSPGVVTKELSPPPKPEVVGKELRSEPRTRRDLGKLLPMVKGHSQPR